MATAQRDRPHLPKGYISRGPRGMLRRDDAERILRLGRFYRIATTDADGHPHLTYGHTFSYRPTPEQYEKGHAFRARPTKVIAFHVKRFNSSATRFTYGESG